MVILQRGVPATIDEKNLRKSQPVSMSDAEREMYAIAAKKMGMSLSHFIRQGADMMVKVANEYGKEGQQ